MTNQDYPFLRAYERIMGSYQYYVDDMLARARDSNAPQDAWALEAPSGNGGPEKWRLARDLIDNGPHSLRARFEKLGLYARLSGLE